MGDKFDFEKSHRGVNEERDVDFTQEEISINIIKLKNDKACCLDFIRNELLKNLSPRLLSFTCSFFNFILSSGLIPDDWCIGMIMPLYKRRGQRDDPNNIRGITLLSCFGKLFTACLNTRIAKFLFIYNKIGAEQAGFRPGFSVLDHIFTLHAIIEFYKNKKQRLYCAFIDYSKAFDLIDRSALWKKLLQHDMNGRVFQIICNIYKKTKSCVKSVAWRYRISFHVILVWGKVKIFLRYCLLYMLMTCCMNICLRNLIPSWNCTYFCMLMILLLWQNPQESYKTL